MNLIDLDADGDLDILIPEDTSGIRDYRNDGQGHFTLAALIPTPENTQIFGLDVGDIDGDGDLDFVGSYYYGIGLLIGLNDGTGSFSQTHSFGSEPSQLDVDLADLDGDGDLDILTGYILYFNSGDGIFTSRALSLPNNNFGNQALGDVDGDGLIDIARSAPVDYNFFLLRNRGGGEFFETQSFSTGAAPGPLTIGDFTLDGRPDVIVANTRSAELTLLEAAGGGFKPGVVITTPAPVGALESGDFDGDGRLDLACILSGAEQLAVLRSNVAGGFLAPETYSVARSANSIAVGDMNDDGFLDIAVGSYYGTSINIFLNNRAGGFIAASTVSLGTYGRSVALKDLDGDGILELIGNNYVFLNQGQGQFSGQATTLPYWTQGGTAFGDLDGDGDLDVALPTNGTILLAFNDGTGRYQNSQTILGYRDVTKAGEDA